jgi:large subunit ribosomal protein L9
MKLILTHEVAGLGTPGDVVDVKDGYGRNYLMPRGLGVRWTKGGERQIESIQKARQLRTVHDIDEATEIKNRLENLHVVVPARSAQGGRLFGAVSVTEIAEAIASAGGPSVDKRRIQIAQPLKTIGAHQVVVSVHDELTADVRVEVVKA